MKYIITIILFVGFTFAQSANGKGSSLVVYSGIENRSVVLNYLNVDLDSDGKKEVLKGGEIIILNENEVWVKNTELVSQNGDTYFFGNKLKMNEVNIVNQVTSENGYILVYGEIENELIVYLADASGKKDSDAINIRFN